MRRAIPFLFFFVVGRALAADSGPTLIYEEEPTLLVTTVEVVFFSGAAQDPQGKHGLANFVSELMLRGTKKRSRGQFQSELERMGASLGVHASHDHVTFVGAVIKENTLPFLKLIEDCLLRPSFSRSELASLKTELLADIAHWKNSNNRLSGLALRKLVFSGTPLELPSDGSLTTVKSITLKDVLGAYNRIFSRGNLILGISSALKEEEIKKAVTPIWDGLPETPRAKQESIALTVPAEPQLVIVHKPKTSTGALVFGQAGITVHDKYRYTLGVANYSFGAEPLVSRLFRIVRSELGWTYSIGSSYGAMGSLSDQQGVFTISATPSVEFTTKTLTKVLALWREYLDGGLGGGELTLAHESMVNSYPFDFDSAEKRLSEKVYSQMYGVPILSPEEYKKTIEGIGRDEIKEALKARQTANGWVIALVADADEIKKQLETEQKDIPAEKRLKITKVLTPDEVIQ